MKALNNELKTWFFSTTNQGTTQVYLLKWMNEKTKAKINKRINEWLSWHKCFLKWYEHKMCPHLRNLTTAKDALLASVIRVSKISANPNSSRDLWIDSSLSEIAQAAPLLHIDPKLSWHVDASKVDLSCFVVLWVPSIVVTTPNCLATARIRGCWNWIPHISIFEYCIFPTPPFASQSAKWAISSSIPLDLLLFRWPRWFLNARMTFAFTSWFGYLIRKSSLISLVPRRCQ